MKIGIIGGAGPYASALLYEAIIAECYRAGIEVPELLLVNFPFSAGRQEENVVNRHELKRCVDLLVRNTVELGVLACNTLHTFLSEIDLQGLRFMRIPQVVLSEAQRCCRRLFILGTPMTRKMALYANPTTEIMYPSPAAQQIVDQVIHRINHGVIREEDAALLATTIPASCDGVVLGCTDLPVIHHRYPIPTQVPIFDSIKIPAKILTQQLRGQS